LLTCGTREKEEGGKECAAFISGKCTVLGGKKHHAIHWIENERGKKGARDSTQGKKKKSESIGLGGEKEGVKKGCGGKKGKIVFTGEGGNNPQSLIGRG